MLLCTTSLTPKGYHISGPLRIEPNGAIWYDKPSCPHFECTNARMFQPIRITNIRRHLETLPGPMGPHYGRGNKPYKASLSTGRLRLSEHGDPNFTVGWLVKLISLVGH